MDFRVGLCYGVASNPLTRSPLDVSRAASLLRALRGRHQQLFRPIVALSYGSRFAVNESLREKERERGEGKTDTASEGEERDEEPRGGARGREKENGERR